MAGIRIETDGEVDIRNSKGINCGIFAVVRGSRKLSITNCQHHNAANFPTTYTDLIMNNKPPMLDLEDSNVRDVSRNKTSSGTLVKGRRVNIDTINDNEVGIQTQPDEYSLKKNIKFVAISVVIAVIGGGILYWLGWN